jgi:hypothetical protein
MSWGICGIAGPSLWSTENCKQPGRPVLVVPGREISLGGDSKDSKIVFSLGLTTRGPNEMSVCRLPRCEATPEWDVRNRVLRVAVQGILGRD